MKSVSGKRFAKILEKNGWVLSRIQGSHYIFAKEGREERIPVPIHSNKDIKIGLLKHFMKVAGLTDSDIE